MTFWTREKNSANRLQNISLGNKKPLLCLKKHFPFASEPLFGHGGETHPMNSAWSHGVYKVQHHNSKNCQAQGTTYQYQVFDLRRKFGWEIGYKYCKKKYGRIPALSSRRGILWDLSVCFSCLRQGVVGKEQCFLLPAMVLFHALPTACLKPFNKPFPGSCEGSSESTSLFTQRLHRSCPVDWHLTDKFVFYLHQSQYFGFSVFGFSLYRRLWAVLQKRKFGHSGVLCRAVRYLHQLLQEPLGCLLLDMNTFYLAAQIPMLLFSSTCHPCSCPGMLIPHFCLDILQQSCGCFRKALRFFLIHFSFTSPFAPSCENPNFI